MKKFIAAALCLMLACFTGCQPSSSNPPTNDSGSKDGSKASSVTEEELAEAYYEKYQDMASKYGDPALIENAMSEFDPEFGSFYLGGVVIVDILDFNGDGVDDILFVYLNGKDMATTYEGFEIPRADNYEIEVWTYLNGEMVQLLRESSVGSKSVDHATSFSTEYCFVTVLKDGDSLPVIQLYSEDRETGLCFYTNIYFEPGYKSGDEVVRNELSYGTRAEDGEVPLFQMNGEAITEDEWSAQVCEYGTIMLSVMLSSPTYTTMGLYQYCGIGCDIVFRQTGDVVWGLMNGELMGHGRATGESIAPYLGMLDQANRSCLDLFESGVYPSRYLMYDINGDGVVEMVTERYDEEFDRWFDFYTVADGEIVEAYIGLKANNVTLHANGEAGMIGYIVREENSYELFHIYLNEDNEIIMVMAAAGQAEAGEFPTIESFGKFDPGYRRQGFSMLPIPVGLYQGTAAF